MLLDGIFAAITTPFYSDERIYLRKLESNVEHLSRSPLAGLLVLGSTGESTNLNDEESAEVLKVAAAAAAPTKSLIAGISRESVRAALELAEVAAKAEYDAVLVRMPSYYRRSMTDVNLLNYFRAIADRSPLPVVLYNIPQCVQFDLPVEIVAELAQHKNIVGIKDSSGDLERLKKTIALTGNAPKREVKVTPIFEAVTKRMLKISGRGNALVGIEGASQSTALPGLKTRTKEVGFQVMTGAATTVLDSLEAGATGATLALADFAPQAATDIYNAWKQNDPALARTKQEQVEPVAKRIVGQLGIPGVKYACDFNGYYGGNCRAPFLPLTAAQKNEVEKLLTNMRN